MKTRKYYEQLFNKYPDVVTLSQFRNMLGGIGDGTARKLMRENRVKHYYIRSTYLIPKAWVLHPSFAALNVLQRNVAQICEFLLRKVFCLSRSLYPSSQLF